MTAGRMLVIDDDNLMHAHCRRILQTESVQLLSAYRAEDGVRMVRESLPDLVLLDLVILDVDGLDVLRTLKADPATAAVPVLVITALDDVAKESRCLNAGAADFIQKPVNPDVLRARVRLQMQLLDRHAALTAAIADLEAKHRRLEYLSCHDALTGLYNRSMMDEVLRAEFATLRRHGRSVGVLMLDVDHFKQINDGWGHPVGDQVLVALAGLLKHRLREGDMSFRYGGEEFLLVLPHTDAAGVRELAAKIPVLVSGAEDHLLQELRVTASVGATVALTSDQTYAETLARADRALYRAKRGGRNRAVFIERDE